MKVIHILHELKFSGAEIMYVDAAPLFQEKGCELTVVATANNLGEFAPYFEKAGFKVLHMPYPALKNYFSRIIYYLNFIRFLKHENFDVVHIHSSKAMWGMSLCSSLSGKHSVYTFHGIFPTHFYSHLYHCMLRWSAKNLFNCRFQSISDSVYEHELKLYHNKTNIIYNWYGSNRFYPSVVGEKENIRQELSISQDTFVMISVGGCSPIKRHSEIIKALPMIIEKIPNCLYLHLGKGDSEIDEIALANQLGVSKYIRFCDNQSDIRKYLIASDIYIMTSISEGISLTTIEAMACNIPTVLYDVQGLRDFNKTGENSVLIPEDYQLLANKIIYLYSHTELLDIISLNAIKLVTDNYNMRTNALKVLALYSVD